ECGADGYIPPCVHFPDIVEATRMTVAGATFLSRESLMALRNTMAQTESKDVLLEMFTGRQLAVAQALRRGAANKTIAYLGSIRPCQSLGQWIVGSSPTMTKEKNPTQPMRA
ncbi:MAG: hypothetical protein KKI10_05475, partial [Alphaproteobacteria bacterium]|nr:hypothetical protein [Alphaproteobacteria bacterium]